MSNQNANRNKKDEKKKVAVRVVCIALAGLMALSAFASLLPILTAHVH